MNIGTARAIFANLENGGEPIEVKGMAIRKVIDMETHNSVTKEQMLKAMDWMWNQIFELKQEGEDV